MRNRPSEAFEVRFGQTGRCVIFSWGGTAVVPGGDALQDQGHHILRFVRVLQATVDGVGQADNLAGGAVGLLGRGVVLRYLTAHFSQQVAVSNRDLHTAVLTPKVQCITPLVLSADTQQPSVAIPTAEKFLQPLGRPLFSLGPIGCLSPDHALDGIKSFLLNDGWVSIRSGVAGVLQQTLYLVLVPERGFLAERDTVAVESVADLLVGQAVNI